MGPASLLVFPQLFLQVFGAGLRRQAEAEAFSANSAELERQARMSDANALDALRQGSLLAGAARRKGTRAVAAQQVALVAGGIDANAGSAANLAATTRGEAEVEANALTNNAAREAWGMQEVGRRYRFQRQQLEREEANARLAFGVNLGGALLGAGASLLGGKP